MKKYFSDTMQWDPSDKTAISVRDGVLEYYGSELGLKPSSKIFTVYRSPATIANVAQVMEGIPVTDQHIDMSSDIKSRLGVVDKSEMIDLVDEVYNSKLAIKNKLRIEDVDLLRKIDNRELSLGYLAKLEEHATYDFEQKNIVPHHLAVVESGRCGSACSFLDKKEVIRMAKDRNMFLDENGETNLEEIVKVVQDFQEAIKKAPADKVLEILPALKELIALAKEMEADRTEEVTEEVEERNGETEEVEKERVETEDEDGEVKELLEIKDSSEFKDAVKSAIARHTEVIEKASEFLDDRYKFAGKDTCQIMRDALKTQCGREKFEDSEIALAFKMLRKVDSQLKSFGDNAHDAWDALKTKEY